MRGTSIPKQLDNHTLDSINKAVILRYEDRPLKLRNHLPFAVDYENKAFHSSLMTINDQEMSNVYK